MRESFFIWSPLSLSSIIAWVENGRMLQFSWLVEEQNVLLLRA